MNCTSFFTNAAAILALCLSSQSFAAIIINPLGTTVASLDGTDSPDVITNLGTVTNDIEGNGAAGFGGSDIINNSGFVTNSINGSRNTLINGNGGFNSITNSGTVHSILGSFNQGFKSSGGSSIITNSGVTDFIHGSSNMGDYSYGGNNTIYNSGTINLNIAGSVNSTLSSGGSNSITNIGTADDIYGSYNSGLGSCGGSNSIINSGSASFLYGSYNWNVNSNGGVNLIMNAGVVNFIVGSDNVGAGSSGGFNNISNSQTVSSNIFGSYSSGINSNGGSNTITNSGTAFNIYGAFNFGDNSNGGSNTITNSGTVNHLYGSYNSGDNSNGGSNAILNSGTANSIFGSYNSGDNNNSGSNSITNTGSVSFIYGSYNNHANYGDFNTIINSGSATEILGSWNGLDSSGGSNSIINSGSVTFISGSSNSGLRSNGGSNSIINSGYVVFDIYGSNNIGASSHGGSNTIINSGTVQGDIIGSWNFGANSTSTGNTITNTGYVGGSIWGSKNDGAGSSGGDDTITNSGTARGSIYGADGNDTIILAGGSTLGGVADGGTGTDTLDLNNMGTVDGSLIGSKYLNFENLSISGGSTNLTGSWNFSTGSLIVDGTMSLEGSLNIDSFTVTNGGYADITGSLTGDTVTIQGDMNLNGSLTSDDITIASSAFLGGSGQVNGNLVNFGSISPGNSIGTLHVDGSVSFMPGSVYLVELRADGASDRIEVGGPMSIHGGTVITSLPRSLYADGDNWEIIAASGGISGRFDSLSCPLNSETLDLQLVYNSREVLLEIVRTPFTSFGLTPAAIAIGSGLDGVVPIAEGNMAGFITSMDFDMSRSQIESVLNSLSPEMYATFSAAGLHTAKAIDQAAAQHQWEFRQRNIFGLVSSTDENTERQGEWSIWSRAFGNWNERDSEDGYLGYNYNFDGFVAGMDRQFFKPLRVGFDFAYTDGDLDWEGLESSGSLQSKHLGLYASADPGNFFIDASAGYYDLSADAARIITFNGLSAAAQSNFDAHVWAGRIEGGYNFTITRLLLSPIASLNYAHYEQDDFSEQGADFLNLDIDETATDSLTSTLGIRCSGLISTGKWQYMPHLDLRWLHQFKDDEPTITANFTGYGSASFDVAGVAPAADQGILSLGLSGEYNKSLSLLIDFGVAMADGYTSQLISGGMSWKF